MNQSSDKTLVRAYRGERFSTPPLWFMRQAGRYLPEYQEIRSKYSLIDCMTTPSIAAEITLQPIRRYALDGAIIFADILTPLIGMGMKLKFVEGRGPVFENPIRRTQDIAQLSEGHTVEFTLGALRLVSHELKNKDISLIGFCGAPFTLSCYMIEGHGGSDPARVRAFMKDYPRSWASLQEKIVTMLTSYLVAQVEAGAEVLQVFDSWLGYVSVADFQEFVLPFLKELFSNVKAKVSVPLIFFSTATSHLLPHFKDIGFDVLGVDWRNRLVDASQRFGKNIPIQGNLDPAVLLSSEDVIKKEVQKVLEEGKEVVSHIFNLGHGILPPTPPENVKLVIDLVKGK